MKVAIASGKGGTGKTTIATNLAFLASADGGAVACTDCDVGEPNGHLFLHPQRTIVFVVLCQGEASDGDRGVGRTGRGIETHDESLRQGLVVVHAA
ncbi:MAG: P-loop NTPase [Pirellulaceae bacterium]|jgi:septum formation inhibitor-activating ATPase MinD|nr:P-loop NTPase [Pirellulaceae bacterium]